MESELDSLVSVSVAARILGVSRQTIREWEESGRIPRGMRLDDGRRDGTRIWRESELRAAMTGTSDNRRSAATSAA